jgi:hypothetical protein
VINAEESIYIKRKGLRKVRGRRRYISIHIFPSAFWNPFSISLPN